VYEHAEAPQYPRPIDVHDLVSVELLVDPAYMINRLKRYTELSVKPKQRLYKLYREDPTDKRAWLNPFYQLAIGDKKVLRQNVEFAANNGLKWVDNKMLYDYGIDKWVLADNFEFWRVCYAGHDRVAPVFKSRDFNKYRGYIAWHDAPEIPIGMDIRWNHIRKYIKEELIVPTKLLHVIKSPGASYFDVIFVGELAFNSDQGKLSAQHILMGFELDLRQARTWDALVHLRAICDAIIEWPLVAELIAGGVIRMHDNTVLYDIMTSATYSKSRTPYKLRKDQRNDVSNAIVDLIRVLVDDFPTSDLNKHLLDKCTDFLK
jgi:hypothetical protein